MSDTGWYDKDKSEGQKNVPWHKVAIFRAGFIGVLKERGRKGARMFIAGELVYRTSRKTDDQSDRIESEILVGADDSVNFIDREKAISQVST